MPKVSIIIPVYGEKKWLVECLNSIKASCSFELIVESDPEGTGAANARNRALKRAVGEYVMFCDSDDYLEPGAIDLMLSEIDGVDLVCGSFRKFGDFEMIVSHPTHTLGMQETADYVLSNLKAPSENQMLSGCWAKLYKRELITNFPNLVTGEDVAFNFNYLSRCKTVAFIQDMVYNNRKHSGSLTNTFDENKRYGLFGLLEGIKYTKSFLLKFYSENEIENAIDNFKVYHSALYAMRISGLSAPAIKETLRKMCGDR